MNNNLVLRPEVVNQLTGELSSLVNYAHARQEGMSVGDVNRCAELCKRLDSLTAIDANEWAKTALIEKFALAIAAAAFGASGSSAVARDVWRFAREVVEARP